MSIDFPDKLRSTRRDHKLVDAAAIDGVVPDANLPAGHVWRPFFYVLQNVGPAGRAHSRLNRSHIYEFDQPQQRWTRQASRVTAAFYRQARDELDVGIEIVNTDGSTNQNLSVLPEGQTPAGFETRFTAHPPLELAETERLFAIWAYLEDPIVGNQDGRAIVGPVWLPGGYVAGTSSAQKTPLIENIFDGTTGTDTGEVQVDGVAIGNSATVAYLIRVGAATEYTLGSALYALRSGTALQIGIANFYSKAGNDAGKLYRTLDEATDTVLEIWRVNDLAAIRSVIGALADGVSEAELTEAIEAHDHVIDPIPAADLDADLADGIPVGDVVLSGGRFHRSSTASTANIFAGTAAAYSEGSNNYLVTSDPDSALGLNGAFSSNPGGIVGALVAGVNVQILEVRLEANAYEAAKGGAIAADDTITARLARADDPSNASDLSLTYTRLSRRPQHHWYSFETTGAAALTARTLLQGDADWRLEILQGGSALFVHDAGAHFTEYPIYGVDEYAREQAAAAAAQINPYVIDPLDPLDTAQAAEGEVVLHDHAFHQRSTATEVTADTFSGVLASWLVGRELKGMNGTALSSTRFGARGYFTANPGNKVGAITAGGEDANKVGLRLDKTAYESAKGSAVAAGDTVYAEIGGGLDTSVTELTYIGVEDSAGTDYLAFEGDDATCVLHGLVAGNTWHLRVLSTYDAQDASATTPLFEHDAQTPHYTEYPIDAVADDFARAEILTQGQNISAEIAQLHGYIGHHIAETSDTPLDPEAAAPPDRYYLTTKGRVSNVAMEPGLYEHTTGAADRLKITLERITVGDETIYGMNSRGFLTPYAGRKFGANLHNPSSILQALWLRGDYINACFKSSWFNDRENRQLVDITDFRPSFEKSLLWLLVYLPGGNANAPVEIELGQASGVTGLASYFVRGDIQYQMFSSHVASAAAKDAIRHLFPYVSGNSGPRQAEVTFDMALSPVRHSAHPTANPRYRLGATAGETHAYTWREAGEPRVASNLNALIDLLAGASDLASIPDASLTDLKL